MKLIDEKNFQDSVVRAAAQAIVEHEGDAAVAAAIAAGKVNYVGPEKDTILNLAIMENDAHSVRLLLDGGANPNLPAERAPLAMAVEEASKSIIKMLLEAGADPNGEVESQSALLLAAGVGRREIVDLLLAGGARIDSPDVSGNTALTKAVMAREYELATYLLERGANPFAHDTRGRTAADWAYFASIDPASSKGRERERLFDMLKARGYPWPPPSGDAVLAMEKRGAWPPR